MFYFSLGGKHIILGIWTRYQNTTSSNALLSLVQVDHELINIYYEMCITGSHPMKESPDTKLSQGLPVSHTCSMSAFAFFTWLIPKPSILSSLSMMVSLNAGFLVSHPAVNMGKSRQPSAVPPFRTLCNATTISRMANWTSGSSDGLPRIRLLT